ncbi:MAG: hypothetical protein R6U98_05980 [Pirellulaceae bacterium]
MFFPRFRPNATRSTPASRPRASSWLYTIALLAVVCGVAANYRSSAGMGTAAGGRFQSRNFRVTAPTAEFARQVCTAAEKYRRELAVSWLGRELPKWQDPCPIRVIVGARRGAGGATSFTFINGEPRDWKMKIQGSRQRILDSVLPHEITHTIMATHFGGPLPRWADEGAATSVEHTSEREKQDRLLIEFLTTNRGIAFNRMFAMKEYPRDILPLYSQGYSLARYLIARGGRRKFVQYVGDGMKENNWTAATEKHYDVPSLSELQVTWLDWVRKGSPDIAADMTRVASTQQPGTSTPEASTPETNPPEQGRPRSKVAAANHLVPLPSATTSATATPRSRAVRPESREATPNAVLLPNIKNGWYSRRRDEAMQQSAEGTSG